MKNIIGLIINIFLITISFSQVPCILGEVYVSEAANQGDPNDYIEVYNGGNEECTLAGFQLDDSEDLEDFTFGNVILNPGDYWFGYENAEDSFNSGLDADGDNVVFADASGNMLTIILEESIEIEDGVNLSQSYGSDGSPCYTMPSPGVSNAACFEFIYGCTDSEANNYDVDANINDGSCEYPTVFCVLGEVYVSEAANQGDPNDYIEVYNGGNEECTLAGFQLDDSEGLEDFTFGYVILNPGDYWLGYEDAEDSFSSGLNADGDNVVFADADGNMLTIILEESVKDECGVELSQSYGSDGAGCYTISTPGYINEPCYCLAAAIGDLNGDLSETNGGWNVLDIVVLTNCILAEDCLSLEYGCAGDVNGDIGYNVLDIVFLVNCILADNCSSCIDDFDMGALEAER